MHLGLDDLFSEDPLLLETILLSARRKGFSGTWMYEYLSQVHFILSLRRDPEGDCEVPGGVWMGLTGQMRHVVPEKRVHWAIGRNSFESLALCGRSVHISKEKAFQDKEIFSCPDCKRNQHLVLAEYVFPEKNPKEFQFFWGYPSDPYRRKINTLHLYEAMSLFKEGTSLKGGWKFLVQTACGTHTHSYPLTGLGFYDFDPPLCKKCQKRYPEEIFMVSDYLKPCVGAPNL